MQDNAHFTSYFSSVDVICQCSHHDRDAVFHDILKKLAYNRGIGNVEEAFNAVVEREEGYSTVISRGLAVPHARLTSINDLVIGIATSREGIIFESDPDNPVHLVVLILTPKDQPSLYLQVLSSLSKTLVDESIVPRIAEMTDPEDVWKFFNRQQFDFPDYICAGDIMNPKPVALKESETLERAIDIFVRENMNEIPVVDADGDLVGVVTAYELLHVCLPDYILWMDDLSPILNFEPFSHILQNESSTWLAEIMSQEYAVVNEKDPAITVAQEITKHRSNQAFVLRDKKLVGVITLHNFLNKILRE